jgi:hypothetical protein
MVVLTKNLTKLIGSYYDKNYDSLGKKQFHFSSRHYLWFNDKKNLARLKRLKSSYIGNNQKEVEAIILNILNKNYRLGKKIKARKLRKKVLLKYPLLIKYERILFKILFTKHLYKYDISPIALKHLDLNNLIKYRDALYKNKKDLATLSTLGLNFIYNLRFFLNLIHKDNLNKLDPAYLFEVAKIEYNKDASLTNRVNLQLYYYTHCIINESEFYFKKIKDRDGVYLKMLKTAERIIFTNYLKTRLDNKVEFLVCCKLLNYKTKLFDLIYSECETSLSNSDNYLINKRSSLNDLKNSEHRNILFLMAFSK